MKIIALIIGYIIGFLFWLGIYKIYNLIKYRHNRKNKNLPILK